MSQALASLQHLRAHVAKSSFGAAPPLAETEALPPLAPPPNSSPRRPADAGSPGASPTKRAYPIPTAFPKQRLTQHPSAFTSMCDAVVAAAIAAPKLRHARVDIRVGKSPAKSPRALPMPPKAPPSTPGGPEKNETVPSLSIVETSSSSGSPAPPAASASSKAVYRETAASTAAILQAAAPAVAPLDPQQPSSPLSRPTAKASPRHKQANSVVSVAVSEAGKLLPSPLAWRERVDLCLGAVGPKGPLGASTLPPTQAVPAAILAADRRVLAHGSNSLPREPLPNGAHPGSTGAVAADIG